MKVVGIPRNTENEVPLLSSHQVPYFGDDACRSIVVAIPKHDWAPVGEIGTIDEKERRIVSGTKGESILRHRVLETGAGRVVSTSCGLETKLQVFFISGLVPKTKFAHRLCQFLIPFLLERWYCFGCVAGSLVLAHLKFCLDSLNRYLKTDDQGESSLYSGFSEFRDVPRIGAPSLHLTEQNLDRPELYRSLMYMTVLSFLGTTRRTSLVDSGNVIAILCNQAFQNLNRGDNWVRVCIFAVMDQVRMIASAITLISLRTSACAEAWTPSATMRAAEVSFRTAE